jgi:hypothetical protein
MKFVVEFKNKKSWGFGEVDVEQLNKELVNIQKDGITVISITPIFSFMGAVHSYSLLLEDNKT